MKKLSSLILIVCSSFQFASSQCTITGATASGTNSNATTCVCPPGSGSNCDLLPDISIAQQPLNQPSNYTEYPQVCNPPCSGNDGRLRIGVSTPIIGYGPLESRGTAFYVCGTDTLNAGTVSNIPATCPGTGLPPKQLIMQRIYRKNGNSMNYYERPAGSMTFHPSHGHQHVDDWGIYTLRVNNGDPNPLNWPIVGTGSKLGYCLIDLGNCTSSSGYCRDSLGNILNNTNIPNYGLGGGNYGCNNTVQGITNGYMDTYSQSLDGMWINIPPGTCNGTYWVVIQIDPYNYFLETNENNNVVAVPITLTKQVPSGTATITANKAMPICASETVTLTANAATSYLWSTGATTQSITVSGNGTYTVTTTNSCGSATSVPFNVTTTGPAAPSTQNATRCGPGSVTLSASGSGTINWFSSASGGSSLGTGTSFVTPNLNSTTNYFAEVTATAAGQTYYCPPAANTIGSGGYNTSAQYLTFNVSNPCTLKSVKIYAQSAGSLTVQLQDAAASVLQQTTLSVPAGESRITLNYPLSVGNEYRLTRTGTFSLYRNNGGVSYPYTIGGVVSIIGSSAGASYYYFFYDWELQTPTQTCVSARTAATATIHPVPSVSVSANTSICNGETATLTAGGATSYQWSPATGLNTTTGATVNASPGATQTYTVTGTNTEGCTGTNTVTVTVNPLPNVSVSPAGSTSICSGTSTLLNASGASTYAWSPATGLSGTTGAQVSASPSANQTYTVTGTSAQGCTNTAQVSVVVNPLPTVSLSGLASSYQVNAAPVTLLGTPSGGTFSGPGVSGNTFSPAAAGVGGPYSIDYTYTDGNGCSNTDTKQTNVVNCATTSQPGTISTIGGTQKPCPGSVITYKINAVSGATSYNWTPPPGAVITSGQGTVQVTVSYTNNFTQTDTLWVSAVNACGESAPRFLRIVRDTPTTPSAITGNAYNVCNASGLNYSVTLVANRTYNWNFNTGNVQITSGQGTNSITADFLAGFTQATLSVTASNACGVSAARNLVVHAVPATPAAVYGSTSVCANQQGVPYNIDPVPGASSYKWTVPSGARINDGTTTSASTTLITTATNVTVNWKTTPGSVYAKAINACGEGSNKGLAVAITCREGAAFNPAIPSMIEVSPNPASGPVVEVSLANFHLNNARIFISDVIGKVIKEIDLGMLEQSSISALVNISDLKPGVYVITGQSDHSKASSRFIVQ
jgi:hypothetical protein